MIALSIFSESEVFGTCNSFVDLKGELSRFQAGVILEEKSWKWSFVVLSNLRVQYEVL